jgi:cobalt-zinc-cadmium efflux system outer membrane protein
MRFRFVGLLVPLLLVPAVGRGQERSLTLEEALRLARERGAPVALARGRLEEARARQAQAGRRFQENPVLEVDGGYRSADEGDFFDFEASVGQDLPSGARRAARQAGAGAAVDRAQAELAEAERGLLRDVRLAFTRALAARERAALFTRNQELADGLLAATERRYEAGEATALELNRSRTAAATARAEGETAGAEHAVALAGLAGLLGMGPGETLDVRGDLASSSPPDLETLLAGAARRPDLLALEAELREAEAEILLGRALGRPGFGIRGGAGREEGAELVTAGIAVTLPVHNRGQEAIAVGEARASALRQALETARKAAGQEVRGSHAALARRIAAARELERTALPALEDNESLALKSFEAGEIDLGELLLIRREILETRLSHLDRLLDAALARLELEAAAGALP